MAKEKETAAKKFSTKKCYECFTHLPLDATECHACKSRVGPVDRNGIAKKPVNFLSYVWFLVAAAVFGWFIWKMLLS